MEEDGLEATLWYLEHLEYVVYMYCAAEDEGQAVVYMSKLDTIRHVLTGRQKPSVTELRRMVKEHHKWGWKSSVTEFLSLCSRLRRERKK
ncbi:hypothetical protein PM082_016932 [Marasmius tenuissimus]|nr:hypothetical protein PM082_016932 [Marasmius tenuissimus]